MPASSVSVLDLAPIFTTTVPVAAAVPRFTDTVIVGRVPALALLGALIDVVLADTVTPGAVGPEGWTTGSAVVTVLPSDTETRCVVPSGTKVAV